MSLEFCGDVLAIIVIDKRMALLPMRRMLFLYTIDAFVPSNSTI